MKGVRLLLLTVLLALVIQGFAQITPPVGNLLIRHGYVLTVSHGNLEDTDILISNGKIARIGKNLPAPQDYEVVDATGLYVMPGIIDAHSHIALQAINESTNPVTAEVWTGDVVDPFDIAIYHALAGGVTVVHALHGSANAIGGESETLKLRYGLMDPDLLRMENAPRTIKFALGENPTRVHGGGQNIMPGTRMGVEFVIRNALSEARDYMKKWDDYNAAKLKKGFHGAPPRYDRRLETLADVLSGKIIVHCHSYRADEIYMLLQVCKDFGIKRIVFQHGNEAYKVAPELAAYGAMASVFSDWWAYKFEVYYSTAYNAAILTRNGVLTSINSDSDELIRHLYHEAAKTQKYGDLSDDEALKLITINPATELGIEGRVGSIDVGKDGDIAIFRNHPLSIYATPVRTIVDGIIRFNRDKDSDDMRMRVDPETEIDEGDFGNTLKSESRCMEIIDSSR